MSQDNKADHKCMSCHQDRTATYSNISCKLPVVVIDGAEHRRKMYCFDYYFDDDEVEAERIYDSNGRCVEIQYAPLELDHDKEEWEEEQRCHDCNIKLGGIHHAGCDMEICPSCNDQLISCDCKNKAFPILEE